MSRASVLSLAAAVFLATGCGEVDSAESAASAPESASYSSDAAKASYGIGYNLGSRIRAQLGDSIDIAAYLAGTRQALDGLEPAVPLADAQQSMENLTREVEEASVAENTRAGAEYLATNGAREGVVTLPSGLQYEVVSMGEGERPTASDTVTTHYEGRLISGEVFDSSVARGEPATFPLNGVIPGWTEALQLMPVGSKWRLYIPANLAYGDNGAGNSVPPGATLIFEVELLSIDG
jgi:FKBP-type peptidyl-prolyl cis-trans isomerase FklB